MPRLPDDAAPHACHALPRTRKSPDKPREPGASAERPPRRDRSGTLVSTAMPITATTIARAVDGADVPALLSRDVTDPGCR